MRRNMIYRKRNWVGTVSFREIIDLAIVKGTECQSSSLDAPPKVVSDPSISGRLSKIAF
jgi:hypothetical protein